MTRDCSNCGKTFEVTGVGHARAALCSDPCRRAHKTRTNREREARKRRERGEPERRKRTPVARSYDPNPAGIVCAAAGCSKVLSRAAVLGGSLYCTRACDPAVDIPDDGVRGPSEKELAAAAHAG